MYIFGIIDIWKKKATKKLLLVTVELKTFNIFFYIHPFSPYQLQGSTPAVIGQKAGYTLDRFSKGQHKDK